MRPRKESELQARPLRLVRSGGEARSSSAEREQGHGLMALGSVRERLTEWVVLVVLVVRMVEAGPDE